MKNITDYKSYIKGNKDIINFSRLSGKEPYFAVEISKDKIERTLRFVGNGIWDFYETSKYNPKTKEYTNEVEVEFWCDADAIISKTDWDKAESVLNNIKGKDGFDNFVIKSSTKRIVLIFNSKYPMDIY